MSTFPKKEPDGTTSFRFIINQERGVLLLTDDDYGAEGIAPICCINPIMSAMFHRSTHFFLEDEEDLSKCRIVIPSTFTLLPLGGMPINSPFLSTCEGIPRDCLVSFYDKIIDSQVGIRIWAPECIIEHSHTFKVRRKIGGNPCTWSEFESYKSK
jgi:hypothetical protein